MIITVFLSQLTSSNLLYNVIDKYYLSYLPTIVTKLIYNIKDGCLGIIYLYVMFTYYALQMILREPQLMKIKSNYVLSLFN